MIVYGLPLLTVMDCLVPAEIPGYMGAAAAGGIAVILLIRLMRSEWTANVLRAIFYLTVPLILWAGRQGPLPGLKAGGCMPSGWLPGCWRCLRC